MRISHKLTIAIATPLVAMVVVGGYADLKASSTLTRAVTKANEDRGLSMVEEIESLVAVRMSGWLLFAHSPLVLEALRSSASEMGLPVRESLRIEEEDSDARVSITSPDRTSLGQEDNHTAVLLEMRAFNSILTGACQPPIHGEALLTNRFGAIVAQTGSTLGPLQADDVWWQNAWSAGMHEGGLVHDRAGTYRFEQAIRIEDGGEPLGVLRVSLDALDIERMLDERSRSNRGGLSCRVFLLTADSQPVQCVQMSGELERDVALSLAGRLGSGLDPATSLKRKDPDTGEIMLSTVIPSETNAPDGRTRWFLLLDTGLDDALAPLASLRRRVGLAAAVATLVSLLVSQIIAREITGRLDALTGVAERLGTGDLSARFVDTGEDAVSRLGERFNWMANRLAQSTHALEARAEDLDIQNIILQQEIHERKRAEEGRMQLTKDLASAQKLEAIGRLAAGIAHEINTPTQYVGDNIRFLDTAVGSLLALAKELPDVVDCVAAGNKTEEVIARLRARLAESDLEFLDAEVPGAVRQSLEGVERITTIVKAMKDFSHPGSSEKTWVDLNRALNSTVTVGRNEWKYVADVEFDLDPQLPAVRCLPGEINQVFLNIIVNAAHAISEVADSHEGSKGRIGICTRTHHDHVEVRISDTGPGIPEDIRQRIFEPFFTTKGVGKGTGQGLAIAHSVVVGQHHGSIDIESTLDIGTTFVLRLPIDPHPELTETSVAAGATT